MLPFLVRLWDLHFNRVLNTLLVAIFFFNCFVNDVTSFLQLFNSADKVFELKVAPGDRILILIIIRDLFVFRVVAAVVVPTEGAEPVLTCFNQVVKHVDPNKISHFSVHLLAFKQLKCNISIFGTVVAISFDLHVVEVHFPFPDSRGDHYLLRLLLHVATVILFFLDVGLSF